VALENTELLQRINDHSAANLPFHFVGSDLTDMQEFLNSVEDPVTHYVSDLITAVGSYRVSAETLKEIRGIVK
jgi:hypothetical protein